MGILSAILLFNSSYDNVSGNNVELVNNYSYSPNLEGISSYSGVEDNIYLNNVSVILYRESHMLWD